VLSDSSVAMTIVSTVDHSLPNGAVSHLIGAHNERDYFM